jgi:hypothetical protein
MIDAVEPRERRQLLDDVVLDELEARVVRESLEVAPAAGAQVVGADDVLAAGQERFAQIRTNEPSSACH